MQLFFTPISYLCVVIILTQMLKQSLEVTEAKWLIIHLLGVVVCG